jgi:hypothetical protein
MFPLTTRIADALASSGGEWPCVEVGAGKAMLPVPADLHRPDFYMSATRELSRDPRLTRLGGSLVCRLRVSETPKLRLRHPDWPLLELDRFYPVIFYIARPGNDVLQEAEAEYRVRIDGDRGCSVHYRSWIGRARSDHEVEYLNEFLFIAALA